MRIAVVRNSAPDSGGSFVYEENLAQLLSELAGPDLSITNFHTNTSAEGSDDSILVRPGNNGGVKKLFRPRDQSLDSLFLDQGCELAYFLSPSWLIHDVQTTPFICTVWDTGHRDLPTFPEFRGREWLSRERLYSQTLPRAFHVFTDSRRTGEKLEQFYGLHPSRWSSIGLPLGALSTQVEIPAPLPASVIGENFFIYPANKWPHKNHLTILRAMSKLLEKHKNFSLVFTGVDRGMGRGIEIEGSRLGISDAIIDLGHIPYESYLSILQHAKGLLMPTFLGPTNIPPLEAAYFGIRAIVSDRHYFDEPADDFFYRARAESVDDWLQQMLRIVESDERAPVFQANSKDVTDELDRVFREFGALLSVFPGTVA